MRAMVLKEICEIKVEGRNQQREGVPIKTEPLELVDLPVPKPGPKDIVIKISVCGVCRTELDQIEGRILPPRLPIILGHQPVGIVANLGTKVTRFKIGDKVGATWIYSSCGQCRFCQKQEENLCEQFQGTGCHANGGYAEYMVISEDYAHRIPDILTDFNYVAPLMCSGVIGYRSLKLTGLEDGKTLGLYGFGSANQLVIQMANFMFPNSKKFVISRNPAERQLAKNLGAEWVGDIDEKTPEKLDCAIDTTPAWKPTIFALENLEKGGRLVINLIRKEETDKEFLLKLDYPKHLWLEKEVKTVANVTRRDAEEFLTLAAQLQIRPQIQVFELEESNQALIELKGSKSPGSKILKI
ncbi:MAG: zinc-dependent alcohol dehydrogenase family protein [Actinobacteria bacterium]|nr:zinc-dependent alcohol dehydrogenase family protein [Actinomycetota bacterium]MCG2788842.1 zinc-dependent alcohol dehydrogenase family protein [Actinomycetes bacterium]